jgi:rare lipoprotein A
MNTTGRNRIRCTAPYGGFCRAWEYRGRSGRSIGPTENRSRHSKEPKEGERELFSRRPTIRQSGFQVKETPHRPRPGASSFKVRSSSLKSTVDSPGGTIPRPAVLGHDGTTVNDLMTFDIRTRIRAIALLAGVVILTGCARVRLFPAASGQTGIASWYGPNFHGRATSNREIYDMNELTAAHQTLPFGTRVLVTNLENGRTAAVRINDRGPFVKNRIIDLSYAAARLLGMIGPGTAPVRLDILKSQGPPPAPVRYAIQVGSFASEESARELKTRLGRRYGPVEIVPFSAAGRTYYRVRLPANDRSSSEDLARRLSSDGYPVLLCEVD